MEVLWGGGGSPTPLLLRDEPLLLLLLLLPPPSLFIERLLSVRMWGGMYFEREREEGKAFASSAVSLLVPPSSLVEEESKDACLCKRATPRN